MNKLHSACTFSSGATFTHIHKADNSTWVHLNLSGFLFLRHNAPGGMSVFRKVMHAPANLDLVT